MKGALVRFRWLSTPPSTRQSSRRCGGPRRAEGLVQQLHHPSLVTDSCDHRCIQSRRGLGGNNSARPATFATKHGLVAFTRAGHVQQCERALRSSSHSASGSALALQQASACRHGVLHLPLLAGCCRSEPLARCSSLPHTSTQTHACTPATHAA